MFFEVKKIDGRARTGVIHTDHGDILTPTFMPVGTRATVKALTNRDVMETGASVILGNTYHLHLRPGEDLIVELGGLHKFMNYSGPILTDSGGFQVFSLGAQAERKKTAAGISSGTIPQDAMGVRGLVTEEIPAAVKIDPDGVNFRSYIDGSKHRFTPEIAIAIQKKIGADIIMALDICTPDSATHEEAEKAMQITHCWAERCIEAHKIPGPHPWTQNLFGIIQGANHRDLREESARFITSLPFAGIAIGGESIGYNMGMTATTLDWLENLLPADKPRYTMGVGYSPRDFLVVAARGIDLFDCVAPTRIARTGTVYCRATPSLKINLRNAQFRADTRPLDDWCDCWTCQNHSRAYLYHLFKSSELLAYTLASIHNTRFFIKMGEEIRAAIASGQFAAYAKTW